MISCATRRRAAAGRTLLAAFLLVLLPIAPAANSRPSTTRSPGRRPGARPAKPSGARRLTFTPKSVWVHKGPIRVWSQPRFGSPQRGAIDKAGRFPVRAIRPPGGGCANRWYKLADKTWACSGWLVPSPNPATRLTDLERTTRHGPWMINRTRRTFLYPTLKHFAQGRPTRLRGLAGFQIKGRRLVGSLGYLRVRYDGWVQETAVGPPPMSSLVGVTVKKPRDLPLAFVLKPRCPLYRQKGAGLVPTGTLMAKHAVRRILNTRTVSGVCYHQVGSRYWARCQDLAVANRPAPPPAGISKTERWLDLDRTNGILYARIGARVQRVMLVSVSAATPVGLFRIREKMVEMDLMQRWGDDPYYLQQVPYVIFFHKNFALHAAYWHNGFGVHRSHGCVNLSLTDARWIFKFVRPTLPNGYLHIAAVSTDPGSYIRVYGKLQRKTR